MGKSFTGWQGTQCETCAMCQHVTKGGMLCEVFVIPYFVWGQYFFSKVWMKRKQAKRSPKSCWGYCGSEEEYQRRREAVDNYARGSK